MISSSLLTIISLVIVLLSTSFTRVNSTAYYFSSSIGNDNNAGTSPTQPWQTIGALYNRLVGRMNWGDQVYFCKGDQWSYSFIPSATSGVLYASYQCRPGVTARPIITASVQPAAAAFSVSSANPNILVANWSPSSPYYDSMAMNAGIGVRAIYVDTTRYLPARFPNLVAPQTVTYGQTGEFLTASSANGYTIFSSQLTQPANYWAGSIVYVRVLAYGYQPAYVTGSGPGFININIQCRPNFLAAAS
jgi:hypothetical protein